MKFKNILALSSVFFLSFSSLGLGNHAEASVLDEEPINWDKVAVEQPDLYIPDEYDLNSDPEVIHDPLGTGLGAYQGAMPTGNDLIMYNATKKTPYTVTPSWSYHSKINGSAKVEKVLVASSAIIVSLKLRYDYQKAFVQIANVVNMLYGSNLYTTQVGYRKFANIPGTFKPVAAEKVVTYFYTDSARKKLVSTKTHYFYNHWYYGAVASR